MVLRLGAVICPREPSALGSILGNGQNSSSYEALWAEDKDPAESSRLKELVTPWLM